MVLVQIYVPGHYNNYGRKKVWIKGYYKWVDIPIWKMSSFGRRRK